jgi:hypothetical protein
MVSHVVATNCSPVWINAVIDISRDMIAYALIGLTVVIAIPVITTVVQRRKRDKLRRRGIKRYGH